MNFSHATVCAIFFFVSFSPILPLQAKGWERLYDFEKMPINLPPEGFVMDTAPKGHPLVAVMPDPNPEKEGRPPRRLIMRGAGFPGSKFLMSLVYFSSVRNGRASVRFKHPGQPEKSRTAGLVWRYTDENHYYTLEWDTLKSKISLVATLQGKREILESCKAELPPGIWITLGIEFNGPSFVCKVNGNPVLRAEDARIEAAGKMGLMVESEVDIAFDDYFIHSDDD